MTDIYMQPRPDLLLRVSAKRPVQVLQWRGFKTEDKELDAKVPEEIEPGVWLVPPGIFVLVVPPDETPRGYAWSGSNLLDDDGKAHGPGMV